MLTFLKSYCFLCIKNCQNQVNPLLLAVTIVLLSACSESDSSSANNGSQRKVTTLAKVDDGGAWISISVANDRIYFSDMNQGYLQSVPIIGGEVKTHFASFDAKGYVASVGGNVFLLQASTESHLFMLPENSEGVTEIVDTVFGYNVVDITNHRDSIIWTEYNDFILKDSRVLRAPMNITGSHPVDRYDGFATDKLTDLNIRGRARIALDGNELFILEGETGNIYKLNLLTEILTTLAEGLNLSQWADLVVNELYLYGLHENGRELVRINKETGIASTSHTAPNKIVEFYKTDNNSIYFTEHEGNPAVYKLKRLHSETGVVSTLYTCEIGANIEAYYIDGTDVWLFDQITMNEPPPIGIYKKMSIYRIPISGGASSLFAEYNLDMDSYLSPGMDSLSVDSENLYWLSNRQYYKISKSGGTPKNIPLYNWFDLGILKINGDNTVTSDGSTIYKIPKIGATAPETKWTATGMVVSNLAYDDTTMFWIGSEPSQPSTSNIYSANGGNGEPQIIKTIEGEASKVFSFEDKLFMVRHFENGGFISVMPKDGSDEIQLIDIGYSWVDDIYVKDDVLYILIESNLVSYDLNTSSMLILESDGYDAKNLYVDSEHIYWTESSLVCNVYRKSIPDGDIESIYSTSDLSCHAITGDTAHIYVAAGWEIIKIDKD